MNLKEKLQLRRFIRELESIRGRHTELVSVYVPAGYEMIKIIQHLQQEQGTASNIKDARTRNNVIDSLEKLIRHLRLFKKTPPNGLAAFAGNASKAENKVDIKVWTIEPPEPINLRLYRCDQRFVLDPISSLMEHKEVFGLIVLDRREANIGLLKGTNVTSIVHMTSDVPGKHKSGGQCLLPGTFVQIADGSLARIESLHNPYIVKSMNSAKLIDSPITDKWKAKKNKVYKIITKNPRLEVQSSKDHVFFVSTESGIIEKAAEELKEGDHLIMPERIDINGKLQKIRSRIYYNAFKINKKGRELLKKIRLERNLFQRELAGKINDHQVGVSDIEIGDRNPRKNILKKLCRELGLDFEVFINKYTSPSNQRQPVKLPEVINEDFAEIIGYYMGDGSLEKDRITFFEQSIDVAAYYASKINKLFNLNSRHRFRKSKDYHQIRVGSSALVRLFNGEFPEIKKALNSEIPEKILRSRNNVVAAFLRGLFDAEGYASGNRIAISINNKPLAQQIQLLLLRFGIITSLLEYDNRENPYSSNPRFTLTASEKESLKLFQRHIGFSSNNKKYHLKEIIKKSSNRSNVRQILIPGTKIREIIEKAGCNLRMFPKVSNFFHNKRMMGKQAFKNSIMAYVKDKRLYAQLEEIYNTPILPVKIDRIEITNKPAEMTDISVKNQNFIANGLIVHNSAQRFARLREEATKEFFNRINEHAKEALLGMKELKAILVGGPGPTKEEFIDGYLNNELRLKIVSVQDLGYTGKHGLDELVDKSKDVLAKEEIMKEKTLMNKFFELLKIEQNKAAYGREQVKKAIELGAVDKLLLSEAIDEKDIEVFSELAEHYSTEVIIISIETNEGLRLKELGGFAAILRYALYQ